MNLINTIFLIFIAFYNYYCIGQDNKPTYNIGILFDEKCQETNITIIAIRNAIYKNNMGVTKVNKINFDGIFKIVSGTDSFNVGKLLCSLTEQDNNLIAIFGPESPITSPAVESVCSHLELPHIQTNWRHSANYIEKDTVVNIYPDSDLLAHGLGVIVKNLHWNKFVVLYENDDGLIRLQEVLKLQEYDENDKHSTVKVKQLGSGPDYRTLLKEIKNSSDTQIILDCETDHIITILQQAKEVNMLDNFFKYFITSLDAHTVDFSSLESTANITTIRIFNPYSENFIETVNEWSLSGGHNIINTMIKTETALMYDAVTIFMEATNALSETGNIESHPLKCLEPEKWMDGYRITSFLKIKVPPSYTLTGPIKFADNSGKRTDFLMYLVQGSEDKVIATWSPNKPNEFNSTISSSEKLQAGLENLQKGVVKVVSRIGAPYLMHRKKRFETEILIGNDRYEGYSMDLIHAISEILNFTYKFEINENYGKYDPIKKEWNGLINELLMHRAHLAICDLTITYQRRQAVDFSMPFMTLGISILYKKEDEKEVNMFAFLDPFSIEVWIYTATLYLAVSVLLYFIARMAPGDWENPHPCNENPEELENIWDIKNCMWLTLGSIMTQGCDILPKGISSRVAVSTWWFFSLIMTSSYTANLAAFLTMERMEPTIDSAEALAKQTKIKYGTVEGGATQAFFRNSNYSTYQRMWTNMISNKPSVFEKNNADGVKRVRTTKNGLYAFLMESSQIEYEIETKCDLKQVGTWLDTKGYGIAMPVNSAYRSAINTAVLKLQEDGKLQELKNKWWKEKRDEPSCSELKKNEGNSAELALTNVGGVFLVLGIGIAIAFAIAILEFLWNVRNVSVEQHLTYIEALKVEAIFAMNIWVTKKRTKPQISESSSSSSSSSTLSQSRSMPRSILQGAGSFLNFNTLRTNNNEN